MDSLPSWCGVCLAVHMPGQHRLQGQVPPTSFFPWAAPLSSASPTPVTAPQQSPSPPVVDYDKIISAVSKAMLAEKAAPAAPSSQAPSVTPASAPHDEKPPLSRRAAKRKRAKEMKGDDRQRQQHQQQRQRQQPLRGGGRGERDRRTRLKHKVWTAPAGGEESATPRGSSSGSSSSGEAVAPVPVPKAPAKAAAPTATDDALARMQRELSAMQAKL